MNAPTAGAAATTTEKAPGPPDRRLFKIRDLIYEAAGIFQPDNRLRLLEDRCSRRLQELKVKTLQEYLERLNHPVGGREEMVKLLNEITIGETCFFRNQAQLDALKSVVIPRILKERASSPIKKLRIWSAGCSTGEEPYTLAMFFLENTALFRGWTVEIQATDLNERSLEQCQLSVYGDYSTRNVSSQYRSKYFVAAGEKLQVAPAVKRLVTFSRLNLLDASRMSAMKNLDLVFCANVLIYFDLISKRGVISHFYQSLLPHGYLFLGHAESLYGVSDQFQLVHFSGATGYAKSQAGT